MLTNAGSLAAATGITSVLGFAYWIYAARVFPPEAVGYGSAAVSTMTLLGTIGMFGLGTMLIGELPRRESRGGLIMAALITSFAGSFLLGLGFALVALAFGRHFIEIAGTAVRMTLFACGVSVTGATLVFDDATIGLMRGGLQLNRNVAVSFTKMGALPACALVLHDLLGVGITLSWVAGTVVSLVPVAAAVKRGGGRVLYRPDWRSLRQLGRVTLAHNWLNLVIATPIKLIPVLVVIVVSPSSNAAYYVASMLASFLFMVPVNLSTVLFAVASAAPELIAEKLRFVLRTAIVIGVPGGLVLALVSPVVLSAFGSSYVTLARLPLWLMIAGYLPGLPNIVYIDVCRAAGRMTWATIFLSVAAAFQMAAVVIGGHFDGLHGLSYGLLTVAVLEALVTTPRVLRTAYGSGAAGAATAPAGAGQGAGPAVLDNALRLSQELRLGQEDGIAALVALSTTSTLDHYRPGDTDASRIPAWARETRAQQVLEVAPRDNTADSYQTRQEAGIAALIAIATDAARVRAAAGPAARPGSGAGP